eukprot:13865759-Alexandrium_andersonii.AAC.1
MCIRDSSKVGGIYVLEMLIAAPRTDATSGAAGAPSNPSELSEGSGVIRGTPAGGEWRTVARKGAT